MLHALSCAQSWMAVGLCRRCAAQGKWDAAVSRVTMDKLPFMSSWNATVRCGAARNTSKQDVCACMCVLCALRTRVCVQRHVASPGRKGGVGDHKQRQRQRRVR